MAEENTQKLEPQDEEVPEKETQEGEKAADVVELTTQEYEKLKNKAEESENLTKRIKADFENYKKSIEREKEQFKEYAVAGLIEKLLPVLDTFDQALVSTKSEEEKKGLGLIYSQMIDILEKEGLRPIESVGQFFDPYKHEILMQEESDKEDDLIIEEFQKGYMFKDRVLRYSKVKVAKKRDKNGNAQRSGDNGQDPV
ncbi:MAG: nucleotide exchange factor GrpE [Candidatus Nanoarchaeia archaeon]